MLSKWCGKFFYGIAQHCPWHDGGMAVQELEEQWFVSAFAHFAKHPSGCLVDQVVGVGEIARGDRDGGQGYAVFEQCKCGYYGYALFP